MRVRVAAAASILGLIALAGCMPSVVQVHMTHRDTELCSAGLQPLSHCLATHTHSSDVISDDRSEGILLLPTNRGGERMYFELNPAVQFRMMAPQRSGECFDLLLGSTVLPGAPFVDRCVWGPVTVPESGHVSVQVLPYYVGGEPHHPDDP